MIENGVDDRRRDVAAAFTPQRGDARQAAFTQRLFRLYRADKPDRHANHPADVQLCMLQQTE